MRTTNCWSEPYIDLDDRIKSRVELSEYQASFLCGLLRECKPQKVLEVGTAAGGSSCIIMKTLSTLGIDAELCTVDTSEKYYRDENFETGYLADEFAALTGFEKLHKYIGKSLAEVIELIGGDIDFVFLDAAHYKPGELIDFLVCLPFISKGAYFVLHDISLMHKYKNTSNQITANALLFSSVVATKCVNEDIDAYTRNYPNIGGFICTEETTKYVENVFLALFTRWDYLLTREQDNAVKKIISTYYNDELYRIYEMAVQLNSYSFNQNTSENWIKKLFKSILKG